jgi:hypothetical protein
MVTYELTNIEKKEEKKRKENKKTKKKKMLRIDFLTKQN